MGQRRGNRWVPPEPSSVPPEARGTDVRSLDEPLPVHAWFRLDGRPVRRDDAWALAMTSDVVYVEAGEGATKISAWLWRSAVKHRTVTTA